MQNFFLLPSPSQTRDRPSQQPVTKTRESESTLESENVKVVWYSVYAGYLSWFNPQ